MYTILISKENSGLLILSKQVRYTLVNGKVDLETALASKLGMMEPNTQVSGVRIEPMVKVGSFMSMAIYTMATGPTIRLTVGASTNMSMELSMRACGKMTCSTGTEWRLGQTSHATRETMPLVGSMG